MDGRKEGIVIEKYHELGQDTQVKYICIQEYHKGRLFGKETVYRPDGEGDLKFSFSYNRPHEKEELDYPFFSVAGEPLEAYYEVREFDDLD